MERRKSKSCGTHDTNTNCAQVHILSSMATMEERQEWLACLLSAGAALHEGSAIRSPAKIKEKGLNQSPLRVSKQSQLNSWAPFATAKTPTLKVDATIIDDCGINTSTTATEKGTKKRKRGSTSRQDSNKENIQAPSGKTLPPVLTCTE